MKVIKTAELRLREFAGQHKDVTIASREDGSVYVRFHTTEHYGDPYLELGQLKELVALAEGLPR